MVIEFFFVKILQCFFVGIDFIALIEEQKLTTYDRLKIINCIRKEVHPFDIKFLQIDNIKWSNKPKFYIKTPSTEEHDETNAPICLPSRDEWDKVYHTQYRTR